MELIQNVQNGLSSRSITFFDNLHNDQNHGPSNRNYAKYATWRMNIVIIVSPACLAFVNSNADRIPFLQQLQNLVLICN